MELERSNEDLQQFAHVASHDLKEPVRKIKTLTNRIQYEAGNKLSDKEINYLEKVQSATNRMSSMIDGVLLYSTLNSVNQELTKVDLNEIISDIQTDLEVSISENSAIIDTTNLPVIEGAGILIYQLFYNLINNSIKFSRKGEGLRISIAGEIITEDQIQYVKIKFTDNGIGFDSKYAQLIFNTFTRLNSKDQYEGTGLGLALCKKIVMRHRGTISAQGELDKGATFWITLPLSQKR